MLQDLRFAARLLSRDRWFTLAVVSVLALGIGANTTVFTLANAVLEHPLVEWRHVRGSKLRSADFLVAARDLAVIHREYLQQLGIGREQHSIAEKQEKEGGVGERRRTEIKM